MWHGHAPDNQFMHFALSMPFWWYNASVRIDSVYSVRCQIQVSLGLIQQNDTGHFHLNLFSLSESGRGVRVFESEQCSGHIVMATVGLVPEPHYLQWYPQRGWESDVIVHDNHVYLSRCAASEARSLCVLQTSYPDSGQMARVLANDIFVGVWPSMESDPFFIYSPNQIFPSPPTLFPATRILLCASRLFRLPVLHRRLAGTLYMVLLIPCVTYGAYRRGKDVE
jgi:hypothetical protein